MDEELRIAIATINHNIKELNAVLRRLQELTEEHRQAIKKLQQPMRDPAHVHPLS